MSEKQNNYKSLFIDVAKSKGYKVHKPTFDQKKHNVDLILEGQSNGVPQRVTVDIKKQNGKNGHKWVWIEFDTSKGARGWIYGSAQFIVFETRDSFIFVSRTKLLEWLQSSGSVRWDLPYVANAWQAKYRLFRRSGTPESITQITVEDLLNIERCQLWKKL